MSRAFPAEQVEHAFNPRRLNNWEVTPTDKIEKCNTIIKGSAYSTLTSRSEKTDFIVDENGHLLPGVSKINNSFNRSIPVYSKSVPRWPKENPSIVAYPKATMGYKGIPSAYLPSNTVPLATVQIPGCKETNFNFK
mmetsp:Transcript_4020/g.7088  ORF Transcript_4020/g.7088 Transcript_4020/m.7088 type:complete len:136 (-) Transcript_4020:1628-2035(-)